MPDVLSRLPLRAHQETFNINDSFPDDPSLHVSTHHVVLRGPTLTNVALTDMSPSVGGHKNVLPIAALLSAVQPVPSVSTENSHLVHQAFDPKMSLFAECAIIDAGAPSALHQPQRRRASSFRLRLLDSSHENPKFSSRDATKKKLSPPPCRTCFPLKQSQVQWT